MKSRNLFAPFNLRRGKKKKRRNGEIFERKETSPAAAMYRSIEFPDGGGARTRVCTLVSYKCANLSVNARACARGVHVLSIVPLGPFERRRKGDGWEGEEEEEGIVHENYILGGTCT